MGRVYLVGAGPGDPGLITKRGHELIEKADVIVYDRLANPELLNNRKKTAKLIYVGKLPNRHIVKQAEINEILVEESRLNEIVVRLKGGDPYVFGRGAEEAERLHDAGVEFEVVPGISSSIGGLCYAGIPVTHRDFSPSFHVVTGHSRHEDDKEINWNALSKETGTLIFLMGVANAGFISERLIEAGKSPDTPVAFISWASTPMQKTYRTKLSDVVNCISENKIKPPALFVVGDVVKCSEKLSFFEKRELFSKKIAITRTRAHSSKLKSQLESLGAWVYEIPTIKIERRKEAGKELAELLKNNSYDYIALTSRNACENFLDILREEKIDIRTLSNTRFASIGSSVNEVLSNIGVYPEVVAETANAKSLAESVISDIRNRVNSYKSYEMDEDDIIRRNRAVRILFPCSEIAGDDFESTLKDFSSTRAGVLMRIDRVETYTNEVNVEEKEAILEVLSSGVDMITFTSSSTFRNLCQIIGDDMMNLLDSCELVSIGESTSSAIRERGFEPVQSEKPSIDSVVDKIREINFCKNKTSTDLYNIKLER